MKKRMKSCWMWNPYTTFLLSRAVSLALSTASCKKYGIRVVVVLRKLHLPFHSYFSLPAAVCLLTFYFSPHHPPCRYPQYPFTPLVSPLALLWKPVPKWGVKQPAWSRAAFRPPSHTTEADTLSHCVRQTKMHFLLLCWLLQRKPPSRSLCLPPAP